MVDGLVRLRPDDVLPLYHQIKEDLTLQIRSGRWGPEDELPSETELCQHYGVSRGTIRRAIADLVQQGLVHRARGKGTFVSRPKFEGSVLAQYRQFRDGGPPHDAGARVLRCERRRASTDIRRIMSIGAHEEVFEIERVRSVQGTPISLQVSFLPASLCHGLKVSDLSGDLTDDHLYDILEKRYGVLFVRAEEYLEPVLADDYVAGVLSIDVGSPLFLVERFCYTRQDTIGEYRRAFQRGDLYRHRIELR